MTQWLRQECLLRWCLAKFPWSTVNTLWIRCWTKVDLIPIFQIKLPLMGGYFYDSHSVSCYISGTGIHTSEKLAWSYTLPAVNRPHHICKKLFCSPEIDRLRSDDTAPLWDSYIPTGWFHSFRPGIYENIPGQSRCSLNLLIDFTAFHTSAGHLLCGDVCVRHVSHAAVMSFL